MLETVEFFRKLFRSSTAQLRQHISFSLNLSMSSSSITPTDGRGILEQLKDAKAAVDAGLISEEDFVSLKNRLIDGPSSTTTDNEKTDLAKHFRDAERRTHQPLRLQQEKFTNIRAEMV